MKKVHQEKKRRSITAEKEKAITQKFLSKHFRKIYPFGLQKSSSSSLSLSSLSLSLSQNSNDSSSSATDSISSLFGTKISVHRPFRLVLPPIEKKEVSPASNILLEHLRNMDSADDQESRRCNWITKNSDKVYVQFHDECWGVPVYEDNQLFELLAMSGMLMDHNWTEILKRKELLRETFGGFDPNAVAKLEETEISEVASNRALMLTENRVRCIVDNAKCIQKVVKEFGSLSNYIWGYVNYKPIINRYKYPRNVPIRSPKAEAMSKDLLKRGFRLVGPVIAHSFMQAAGLTIDHLVDCYRFGECVSLAERPWRHV